MFDTCVVFIDVDDVNVIVVFMGESIRGVNGEEGVDMVIVCRKFIVLLRKKKF